MIISRRPLLMGAAAAGFAATNAFAQSVADFMGEWHGVLNLGAQQLRLRLVVAEGPNSTLYSVDQGNSAIPVGATCCGMPRRYLLRRCWPNHGPWPPRQARRPPDLPRGPW